MGYIHSPKWDKHKITLKNTYNIQNRRHYSTIKDRCKQSEILEEFLSSKSINPIMCYENVHLEETKNNISKYSKGKSGIYLILNKITLDYYVGSASTNKLYSRYYNHLIGFTGSKIVKLAVKKYNLENFAFIVLELFPEEINKINNKNLLDLEDFYLKSLLPNYNILTEAGNTFGYKHTEVNRIKMKANYSEKRRMLIGNLNRGKTLSEDVKLKLREKAFLRPSREFTQQALFNMKKSSKPITLYNLNGTVYGEYPSITDASINTKTSVKTIIRGLKSKSNLLKKR